MTRPASGRAVGRPRDGAKAEAILDAGWALFLQRGVEGTSIEAIAGAAGVSKVTLYSHFPDRAALFEAAVMRASARIEGAQALPPSGRAATLPERLRAFGIGIMSFLASPDARDFYGAVAGELRRHADLARVFYDAGPGRTRANLAALLAEAAERGELRPLAPEAAADDLFGLWQGFSNYRHALGVGPVPSEAEIRGRVEHGIRVFLRAYGPEEARPDPDPA